MAIIDRMAKNGHYSDFLPVIVFPPKLNGPSEPGKVLPLFCGTFEAKVSEDTFRDYYAEQRLRMAGLGSREKYLSKGSSRSPLLTRMAKLLIIH